MNTDWDVYFEELQRLKGLEQNWDGEGAVPVPPIGYPQTLPNRLLGGPTAHKFGARRRS